MKKILSALLAVALVILVSLFGTPGAQEAPEIAATQPNQQVEILQESDGIAEKASQSETEAQPQAPPIDENGSYTSKEDVALYLRTYGCLPGNFITKKEARALGWEGGSLEDFAPGMCIGGDRFGNYEGLLPEDRNYTECDIDTLGKSSRGAKRIVFSDDGLIYYTDDHYESFELLYGEP
ncbi:MAG: ribonuclease domain-containing protein [Faecousia sp.]